MRMMSLSIALLIVGCGDEGTVARVRFEVEARGLARSTAAPLELMTPSGWSVRLDRALLSLGPLYFRNVTPNAGTVEVDGRVIAQVLSEVTVDALDPVARPVEGGGNGTSEPARSAEVRLAEATRGQLAEQFGPGRVIAHLSGQATKSSSVVDFDGAFEIPAAGSAPYKVFRDHRLLGVPSEFTPDEGGTLTLEVDPSHWLDSVVFEQLGVDGFDAAPARAQLRAGIGSRAAFSFTWRPAP